MNINIEGSIYLNMQNKTKPSTTMGFPATKCRNPDTGM